MGTSYNPFQYTPQAQQYAQTGVQGYGESLRPQILKDIGDTLGGLNEMGALRSGQTSVALGDLGTKYGNAIGAYAKMAAGQAGNQGLQAADLAFRNDQAAQARKASLWKAIGGALGAGLGFAAGGPGGASAGYGIGSAGGGALAGEGAVKNSSSW